MRAQKRDLTAESHSLQDALCGYPGIRRVTADTKALRQLLLDTDGQMRLLGRLYSIQAKSLGVGVYSIMLKET